MPSPGSAPHRALSVVIPLYNEEATLPDLIDSLLRALDKDPSFYELVLVDDGSRDRTAELAAGFAAYDSRIRLVRHPSNRGLGAAIRTGLESASGAFVLYTDADLPFDFNLIPVLMELAREDRLVIGYRLNRGEGARRWLLTKGYNLLCHFLVGRRIRDINFACKLIPKAAANRMSLTSEGSFIDAEIILESRRRGLEIREFPLTYYPRTMGTSTLSRPAVVLGILREMYAYLHRSGRDLRRHRLAARVFGLALAQARHFAWLKGKEEF